MKIFVFILSIGLVFTIDLNDPKTNLDSFIRTVGSPVPKSQTVNYINGTIFLRFPGGLLQKILLVEGFNVARQIQKSSGYLYLSREFLVYRDYKTGEIVDFFINPVTEKLNEVFHINNNPVNSNYSYGPITPYKILKNDRIVFNNDVLLQYPNVLDPQNYPNYSGGPIYQTDELVQFYTSYSKLTNTNIHNLNYTGAWARRSQFLPWLELGGVDGHMYYVSTNWKCLNGYGDVPDDIMNIVRNKYPAFLEAPETYEVPRKTSWSVFKAVIDKRRQEGQEDIIIPEAQTEQGVPKDNNLNTVVFESLAKLQSFQVSFTGQVYSEITGKASLNLFKVKGELTCTVNLTPGGPQIFFSINGDYLDPQTDQVLKTWKNPLTNQTNTVEPMSGKFSKTLMMGDDSVWSFPVPNLGETSVVGVASQSRYNNATGTEDWSVDIVDVFFPDADLKANNPYLYGTWMRFSTWLDWMIMTGDQGLLVWRMNLELDKWQSKFKDPMLAKVNDAYCSSMVPYMHPVKYLYIIPILMTMLYL